MVVQEFIDGPHPSHSAQRAHTHLSASSRLMLPTSGSGVRVSAERIGIWLRCLLDGSPMAAEHECSVLPQCCASVGDEADGVFAAPSCRRKLKTLLSEATVPGSSSYTV
eukprot:COSAG02_NODE_8276_length_2634_cov_1.256016_2_plen_109_part_00